MDRKLLVKQCRLTQGCCGLWVVVIVVVVVWPGLLSRNTITPAFMSEVKVKQQEQQRSIAEGALDVRPYHLAYRFGTDGIMSDIENFLSFAAEKRIVKLDQARVSSVMCVMVYVCWCV